MNSNAEIKEAKNLKNGQSSLNLKSEEVVWKDRKRVGIFALPWSFTKYRLTPSRLFITTGVFNLTENEIRLYRIKDLKLTRTFWERLNNTGSLCIISSDINMPDADLIHIKNPSKIKEILSQLIEQSRRENGVHTSEIIDGGIHPSPAEHLPPDDNHDGIPDFPQSFGPEVFPDANNNGIDDRAE